MENRTATGFLHGNRIPGRWLLGLLLLPLVAFAQEWELNRDMLLAARRGDEAAVIKLLDGGANLDSRNRLGDTALNMAAKNGNTALALKLVERIEKRLKSDNGK